MAYQKNPFTYTPEDAANKSSSYTESSTTTYSNTKALVDGLATKQDLITEPIDENLITYERTISKERNLIQLLIKELLIMGFTFNDPELLDEINNLNI